MEPEPLGPARLARIHEELETETVQGRANGGKVVVEATGTLRIERIEIDREAAGDREGLELLGEMLIVAVNDAIRRAKQRATEKLEVELEVDAASD